jgi:hypothetical protein
MMIVGTVECVRPAKVEAEVVGVEAAATSSTGSDVAVVAEKTPWNSSKAIGNSESKSSIQPRERSVPIQSP